MSGATVPATGAAALRRLRSVDAVDRPTPDMRFDLAGSRKAIALGSFATGAAEETERGSAVTLDHLCTPYYRDDDP